MTFIVPTVFGKKFTCPHCGAISLQRWEMRAWNFFHSNIPDSSPIRVARCDHCEKFSLWLNDKMLYPDVGGAPQPNADLPESVKALYLEAAAISTKSPRGAAALLRLAIQVLCKELGGKGDNINTDIALLVGKGLPERVQQAFDIVRITGNHAVHPGQIDVDDPDVVGRLFDLINVIAEYTISMPARIGSIYGELPESAHEQIQKRDKKIQ
jgi:Domain of unknown function (DUF4145)